jgi:hypothetical protein
MGEDGWKSVKPYVKQKRINYRIVVCSQDLTKLYRVASMPMTLLIDRGGRSPPHRLA